MIRVQVQVCGISPSDVAEYCRGPVQIPCDPHPLTGQQAPVVLGHQFSATVAETGPGVTDFRTGDRVTAAACLFCGACEYCRSGRWNLCTTMGWIGFSHDGAMAPYAVVPAFACYPLPSAITADEGAFTEPLARAIRACTQAGVGSGQTVLVIGAGVAGLLALQVAREMGAGPILAADAVPGRAELARGLGADFCGIPADPGLLQQIKAATGGRLADVALVCGGGAAALALGLRAVGPSGRLVVVDLDAPPGQVALDCTQLHEKKVIGSQAYLDADLKAALGLLERGAITVAPLVTRRLNLVDAVEKGFRALAEQPAQHLAVLIYPGGDWDWHRFAPAGSAGRSAEQ